MGLRGPQPKIENAKPVEFVQEDIVPPPGLTAKERKVFERLVAENRAAGVSIRQVDSSQYADLATATVRRDSAADDRLWLALTRQMDELRGHLLMGPRARGRAGLRDVAKAPVKSKLSQVLELAKRKA